MIDENSMEGCVKTCFQEQSSHGVKQSGRYNIAFFGNGNLFLLLLQFSWRRGSRRLVRRNPKGRSRRLSRRVSYEFLLPLASCLSPVLRASKGSPLASCPLPALRASKGSPLASGLYLQENRHPLFLIFLFLLFLLLLPLFLY